jgi:hypothetical protein
MVTSPPPLLAYSSPLGRELYFDGPSDTSVFASPRGKLLQQRSRELAALRQELGYLQARLGEAPPTELPYRIEGSDPERQMQLIGFYAARCKQCDLPTQEPDLHSFYGQGGAACSRSGKRPLHLLPAVLLFCGVGTIVALKSRGGWRQVVRDGTVGMVASVAVAMLAGSE